MPRSVSKHSARHSHGGVRRGLVVVAALLVVGVAASLTLPGSARPAWQVWPVDLGSPSAPPADQHDAPAVEFATVDAPVLEAAGDPASPDGVSAVLLVDEPARTAPAFVAVAADRGLTELAPGVYQGRLTTADLDRLDGLDGVKVSEDRPISLTRPTDEGEALPQEAADAAGSPYTNLEDSVTTVAQTDPSLAATRAELGIQGAGQVIAIVDSGVDTQALGLSGKVVHRQDLSTATGACSDGGFLDPFGHGTQVASIAAGGVAASNTSIVGVAPQAEIVDVRVFNCAGEAFTSQVDAALQWVIDSHAAWGISVVNLSLSSDSPVIDGTDTTSILVNRLVAAGVFVSVSAGNAGDEPSTISSPGTAQFATTVGAASVTQYGSFLAPYSSQGPTPNGTGVDVIAPGSSIRLAKSTAMWWGDDTAVSSGTSMAAPYVAGLAALLRQQDPSRAPAGTVCMVGPSCPQGVVTTSMENQLEADISTSDWFDPGPDNMTGRGLVSPTDSLRGTPSPPAQQARVTLAATSPNMLEIPAHDEPLAVTVVTDTSILGAWSTDSFEYTWLDASGLASGVEIPCNVIIGESMSCNPMGLSWTRRVWYFHVPPTAEVSWLRLETTREVGASITVPGLDDPFRFTNGITADDVVLDGSGIATVRIERSVASGTETEVTVTPGIGLVAPSAVSLAAGPAGTSASFEVSADPGFVSSAPATGSRLALLDGSSLLLAVSVLFPPRPDLPGPLTVGGLPLDVGEIAEGVTVAGNGTLFGSSQHSLLVRAPSATSFYTGPYVVEPGSNDAERVPIAQTTISAMSTYGISGDGNVVVLSEYPGGSGVVPGDTDIRTVYFVHDRTTGVSVEIGPASASVECAGSCQPKLSEDGRSVAYVASTPTSRTLALQSGEAFGESDVITVFGAEDMVQIWGVTGTSVLVEVIESGVEGRNLRLYSLDGSYVEVAPAAYGAGVSLSVSGSAVGYATQYDAKPVCYRVSDGATVTFPVGDARVTSQFAVGDDCAYLVGPLQSPDGSQRLVRLQPDGSRTVLATGRMSWGWDAYSWVFDTTGTHVVTITGAPLSPGDTNGLVDLYRGAYGSQTVLPWSPTVVSLEPANGSVFGGTSVTVTGTGFTPDTRVFFGESPGVDVVVTSPTSLRVSAPAHARGTVPVVVTTPAGSSGAVSAPVFSYLDFVTQAPVRVLDNRSVTPGKVRCVQVAGTSGVPVGATGVVMNVTSVRPTGPGYVVVYPDSDGTGATAPPGGSTVNFEPGADVANGAFVALPGNGKVCYLARGASNAGVILDVIGFTAPGSGVVTQAPARLLDTRPGSGDGWMGPVAPGLVHGVQVAGRAGVPVDATAVILNVTVTGAQAAGNLRVYPQGQALPTTSVVNYAPGRDKANATIVRLSDSGQVSFYSDTGAGVDVNPVNVIFDVVGYMIEPTTYVGLPPTRVVDTRPGGRHVGPVPGALAPRTAYPVPLAGLGGVPADATAVVLNVTVVSAPSLGNLRVYPERVGGLNAPPNASSINYISGRDIPNLVVCAIPPSGRVTFFSDQGGGSVHLVVDVVGYLAAPG